MSAKLPLVHSPWGGHNPVQLSGIAHTDCEALLISSNVILNGKRLLAGKYVPLEDSISGFKGIMEGKYDDLPEMAFYMVGDISEVQAKADKMAKDMAA